MTTATYETMQELTARHRKERKDLQNRITSMKKQATKSTRKEVNSKCIALEAELNERHQTDLKNHNNDNQIEEDLRDGIREDAEDITPETLLLQLQLENDVKKPISGSKTDEPLPQQTKRRINRQRLKIAKREAEIARMKQEAQVEASQQPNLKLIEQEQLEQLCAMKNLDIHVINPDGHCLFASILDQLQTRHIDIESVDSTESIYSNLEVMKLRKLACDYMREHENDFTPFLVDESTGVLKDLKQYASEMETTAVWGGELEILALAHVFNCPIRIIMSGRADHVVNENGSKPELKLIYYKHTYALGEHYNSLRDVRTSDNRQK